MMWKWKEKIGIDKEEIKKELRQEEEEHKQRIAFQNTIPICLTCVHCVQYEIMYVDLDPPIVKCGNLVKCGNPKMKLGDGYLRDYRGWQYKITKCSEYEAHAKRKE